MKKLSELLMIDLDEAEVLERALRRYLIEKLKEDGKSMEVLQIDKLLKQLKGFISSCYPD